MCASQMFKLVEIRRLSVMSSHKVCEMTISHFVVLHVCRPIRLVKVKFSVLSLSANEPRRPVFQTLWICMANNMLLLSDSRLSVLNR